MTDDEKKEINQLRIQVREQAEEVGKALLEVASTLGALQELSPKNISYRRALAFTGHMLAYHMELGIEVRPIKRPKVKGEAVAGQEHEVIPQAPAPDGDEEVEDDV